MNPIHPTVAWLTLRQMFANKRVWFAAGIAILPLALTLVFKSAAPEGAEGAGGFFVMLQREIVLGILLPLTALVFGTTAFGGEVEDSTLVYLLVKPIPRWQVVTTKYAVAALVTVLVMAPAVAMSWYVVRAPDMPFEIVRALVAGAVVGAVVYTSFFTFLGLLTKRALVIGLLYVVAFENVLSRSGAVGARALSVREFAVSVAQSTGDAALLLGSPNLTMASVRNVALIMIVAAVALTVWKLKRYQMAERT